MSNLFLNSLLPHFQSGNICLDILKEKWSGLFEVRTILRSIQTLLGDPNNDSPLNSEAAHLWSNQIVYKKKLMEHMAKASSSQSAPSSWTSSQQLPEPEDFHLIAKNCRNFSLLRVCSFNWNQNSTIFSVFAFATDLFRPRRLINKIWSLFSFSLSRSCQLRWPEWNFIKTLNII